jgi:hypothetical protein
MKKVTIDQLQFHYWIGAHSWMNSENFSDADRVNELSQILRELVNGDMSIEKLRQEIEASGVLDLEGQQEKVEKLLEDYHPNEIGRLLGVSEQEGKKIVREIYFGWGYTEPDDWEVQESGDDHFILCLKQGDEWIDENGDHVLFESEEEALSHLRESLQLWHDEVARNTYS